jgi:hypothetical protein
LAIFGPKGAAYSELGPWVYAAIPFIVVSFVLNIMVLAPETTNSPASEGYTSEATLKEPDAANAMKIEYAIRMLVYARQLSRPNVRKSRWLALGTAGLVCALVLVTVSYLSNEKITRKAGHKVTRKAGRSKK